MRAIPPASDTPSPRVLITGASSGIGRELARNFARDRATLLLVGRSQGPLQDVADECRALGSAQASTIVADLSDPAAPRQLWASASGAGGDAGEVDVLVNNAGFGAHGPFAEADLPATLSMLQVNVVALTHLTRLFLPGMIARGRGRILNVASTAAFVPGPLMAVYYASKAYVLSFSEAIAAEVQSSGVTVTALCPGPTDTAFQMRAGVENSPLFRANTMTAAQVAATGYRAMLRGKRVVIPGLKNRLMTFAVRLSPRRAVVAITQKLNSTR